MKSTITLLFLALLGTSFGMTPSYPTKQISKYERAQQQTIALPTHFAKPFIIDQKDITLLAGKTIHHVELVYTKYAESPSFDQQALNERRMAELKKVLPQINSDKPSWAGIEQTGATTRDVANGYFHGFVIHYGEKLDHKELAKFFCGLSGEAKEFDVTISSGGTFTSGSGSTIHVPSNAVAYKNGKSVSGNFTLLYTEFRDPAEIALSGLPMLYKGDNFSSIGMYEIRGEKDGEELKLLKPILIDFNCTKVVDDAAFFSMNDDNGEWKKEFDLDFGARNEVSAAKTSVMVPIGVIMANDVETAPRALPTMNIQWEDINKKTTKATLDEGAWANYNRLSADKQPAGIISRDKKTRSFVIETKMKEEFQAGVFSRPPVLTYRKDEFWGTFVATGADGDSSTTNFPQVPISNAGHVYPTLVTGLRSPKFGVYNCDQVYKLGEAARLSPIYKNASSGKKIDDGYVACVIDLTKNGSFSFHPNYLTVSKKGRTAILLFTKEKEIYIIDEADFAKVNLDTKQSVELPMKNVTAELKSPSDLKKMLNL